MFLDPSAPRYWPIAQTPYETETLAFCRAWLSDQVEFVLQTSGSTGTPKLITLTRAQMGASALLTGRTLGLQAGDAALVCLNIRYVAGVMMLVRGLELDLPMTIIEPSGNPLAGFDPDQARFAFAAFVPLQLRAILEQATDKLSILNRMKAILIGGAATSPALEQALQVIESPVFATYGMTETVSHIALRRLNGPERRDQFTALDGVDLGTDERGCLHITSAATNFVRVQTNDVVEMVDTPTVGPPTVGPINFRLLGRADNVINSGGVKVQPEQVEQVISIVLNERGLSWRVLVVGRPDERLGQRITAIYEVADPDESADFPAAHQAAGEAVSERIGRYAVPRDSLIYRATFAETKTGKIDRRATVAAVFDEPLS